MKQFVPFFTLLFFGHTSGYPQNLVANGSFEDENLCTEFHKYCAPEAWIATSGWANYYFRDAKQAYEGYHYVGLTAGNLSKYGVRNFIRTQLLCGLRKGHQYQVEMYVAANNKILDSIGVYFSGDDFLNEKRSFKSIQPAFWYMRAQYNGIPTQKAWQKIRFMYTATGEEAYMTIGLFKRMDYAGITRPDFQDDYYVFLDKVSVMPTDANEKLCDQAEREKRTLYLLDDRHNLLEKRISNNQKNPPARARLPLTRVPQVKHIDTLIIPDIYFITASYELSKKSFTLLDSFSRKLIGSIDSIIIKGHTDSIGGLEYNKELSQNRAVAVKQFLAGKVSILTTPIVARGYAFYEPVASNKTSGGRRKNRRVEIFVYRND